MRVEAVKDAFGHLADEVCEHGTRSEEAQKAMLSQGFGMASNPTIPLRRNCETAWSQSNSAWRVGQAAACVVSGKNVYSGERTS